MKLTINTTKLSILVLLTLQLSSCGESADHLATEGQYEAVSLENAKGGVQADTTKPPSGGSITPIGGSGSNTLPPPNNGGSSGNTNPVGGGTNPINPNPINPNPIGGTGGNNTGQPAATHTIDIHQTVWFPQRGSGNATGTFVGGLNDVLAIKVDFTSPAINFTFHPNASAATLFQAIYKWSSVENQARNTAHFASITPLVVQRNLCMDQLRVLGQQQNNLGSNGQFIDVCTTPNLYGTPYCVKKRQCDLLQAQISSANLNFGHREYDANQISTEVVDQNGVRISNNPATPYGCLMGGYMGMNSERIDFPFVQRSGQFHLQHCSSVGPDKKWFIRLRTNHCNYTFKVPGRPDVRGADANCQLKYEVYRDTYYFN